MLNQYIKLFFKEKKTLIRQFSDLEKEGVKGLLHLKLEQMKVHKRLQTYEVDNVEYYIHSGVFIFPKAYDLLQNYKDSINGFILDTTWKILPLYVTSILAACFANTSVPIGFAFGTGETKKLYKFLISTIEEKLQYSFKGVILESDQGGSLRSLSIEYSMLHLLCYRHFIANLKKAKYSYELIKLIGCRSLFDLQNTKGLFGAKFTEIIQKNPEEEQIINAALNKIGLTFFDETILPADEEQWKKVSLYERIEYCMPSTTNTLESVHGHLNSKIPRRNYFFFQLF